MSGWLSRAKEAFSGRAVETVPEPVTFPCPCGRQIEVIRRATFQRALCKACGESFFVLPLDVYPRPAVRKVRKVSQPTPAEKAKPKSTPAEKAKPKSAPADVATPARPPMDLAGAARRASQRVVRQITPLRLIVTCLLFVIIGTGWWQWNRRARDQAELSFKAAVAAGEAALKAPDLVKAEAEYRRAAEAAELLNRDEVRFRQARQRASELKAINALLQRSLAEIIEEAGKQRKSGDPDFAAGAFAQAHAGRWVVLQADVSPATDTTPTWEQQWQIGGEIVSVSATLPIFSKIPMAGPTTPDAPVNVGDVAAAAPPIELGFNELGQREIIFAARVESLRWIKEESLWRLSLDAASGFLWVNFDLLQAAGMGPDEIRSEAQLRKLLADQGEWIGVSP